MNKVLGRVVLSGTNVGIPRLLVTVYDASVPRTSQSSAGTQSVQDTDESRWNRWGSVITDDRGAFVFTHDDDRDTGNREQRPDLVLVISAPEETCVPGQESRARIATCVRYNAATVESFIIGLNEERLAEASIRIPVNEDDVDHVIEKRRLATQRQARFNAESQRLFVESFDRRRNAERLVEKKFGKFLSALSAVPMEQRNLSGSRYVPLGSSVFAVNQEIIRSSIKSRINQASVSGIAVLNNEQAAMFMDANGQFLAGIPASKIEPFLSPKQFGRRPGLSYIFKPSLLCRSRKDPVDPCVEILEGKKPTPQPQDSPPDTEATPPMKADIPLLIENLVKQMTPPESAAIFSVHTRAGIKQVQEGVDGFTLHSGPADAPALHDFHHLQIAFEHVWQELFDGNVVQTGKKLYSDLVVLGIDPNEYLFSTTESALSEAVKDLLSRVVKPAEATVTIASEPLIAVIEVFDITPKQWAQLYPDQRTELVL